MTNSISATWPLTFKPSKTSPLSSLLTLRELEEQQLEDVWPLIWKASAFLAAFIVENRSHVSGQRGVDGCLPVKHQLFADER